MKRLSSIFFIVLFISCNTNNAEIKSSSRIIITGKILNYSPGVNGFTIFVNRLGIGQLDTQAEIDSLGYFRSTFKSEIPTDIWISYKTNFLVLAHPGDSINLEFDGSVTTRPELLKTIKFSGDRSKSNIDASIFQKMYFSDKLYTDKESKTKAMKEYDSQEYLAYLDTLQLKSNLLFDAFLSNTSPNQETKIWAKTYIEQDYYDALSSYPEQHQALNNLSNSKWSVPISYKDNFLKRLPIQQNQLISSYALSSFINQFRYDYLNPKIIDDSIVNRFTNEKGSLAIPRKTFDSLRVYGTIEHSPDTLMRQMVLAEILHEDFQSLEVGMYEKFNSIFNKYLTLPALKNPLLEDYAELKNSLKNPKLSSNAILFRAKGSSVEQIMDSIISLNRGKVIYIDLWATWCGPCIAEFPNSKKLREKLSPNDVAFVYVCIDSKEELWKPALDRFDIEGQNYFLSTQQSVDMRRTFEVEGIPYYVVLNKNGIVTEKGSHLRPDNVENTLLTLIK